jgi:hypothetical protein
MNLPSGSKFVIVLTRLGEQRRASFSFPRTVGEYHAYWEGQLLPEFSGYMAERQGPGDNTHTGKVEHRCIKEGTYNLGIANGPHYHTIDYIKAGVRPGILVEGTGDRDGILIHPCHDNDGYVSSIGCINPSAPLASGLSKIDFKDSYQRVVALIDAMHHHYASSFPSHSTIPGAKLVIRDLNTVAVPA